MLKNTSFQIHVLMAPIRRLANCVGLPDLLTLRLFISFMGLFKGWPTLASTSITRECIIFNNFMVVSILG